jgi:hypothetical protein
MAQVIWFDDKPYRRGGQLDAPIFFSNNFTQNGELPVPLHLPQQQARTALAWLLSQAPARALASYSLTHCAAAAGKWIDNPNVAIYASNANPGPNDDTVVTLALLSNPIFSSGTGASLHLLLTE